MKSFLDEITEWTDVDICQFILSQKIGLLPDDANFIENKHLFWARSKIGGTTYTLLRVMTALDFLDYNADDIQFRKKIK